MLRGRGAEEVRMRLMELSWIGTGLIALGAMCGGASAQDFPSRNIELLSNIPLSGFAFAPGNGNDCWGYTSPSGREYALMGLSNSVAFVEITDPRLPRIVAQIPHTNSLWAGIKTYRGHAYIVNEAGGGMQVVDMTRIDEGVVALLSYSSPEFSTAHTIAVDEASGYLYIAGARPGNTAMRVYSLENPESPRYIDSAGRVYFHEVTPVTYSEGPYAGRQIVFACAGTSGLEIWDVTNKSAMTRLSAISYSQQRYTHQAWPSEDRRYLYINDELDERDLHLPTVRTIVINIENLEAPSYAASFTNGTRTVDHNLYVKGPYIFEANYTTGLRVFDTRNSPTAPREVGFLDTRPEEHDDLEFRGLWSNYPYFPSGVVIGSDINRGLFVMDPSRALRCMDPDLTRDGFIDQFDYLAFVAAFESGDALGDYNRDGFTDFFDYGEFVTAFEEGC